MGGSRRIVIAFVVALFGAGVVVIAVAAAAGIWFFATDAAFPDPVTLDAREAAVRSTDLAAVRNRLDTVSGWRTVAVRAEASYYTQGKAPVDQRWGLAATADVVGPDATTALAGLGTRYVRVIIVGQCVGTGQFTPGITFGASVPGAGGSPPPSITYAQFATDAVACDGHAHAVLSYPYALPTAQPPDRQWVHLFFGGNDEEASTVDRVVVLMAPATTGAPPAHDLETLAETAFGGPLP